jgi:hypothetical protein
VAEALGAHGTPVTPVDGLMCAAPDCPTPTPTLTPTVTMTPTATLTPTILPPVVSPTPTLLTR